MRESEEDVTSRVCGGRQRQIGTDGDIKTRADKKKSFALISSADSNLWAS